MRMSTTFSCVSFSFLIFINLFDGVPSEEWLDTQFSAMDTSNPSRVSIFFCHNILTLKLYPLCSPQDVELGKMLVRPGSLFQDDLSKANKFSNEGYGSVKRVYVVCDEDICIPMEFQHCMIQNNPVDEVMEIKGADHMPILSKPQQLFDCLSQIAHKYT